MAIKWKNRAVLAAWLLLFSFGLSGAMLGLTQRDNYAGRDYFQTPQFAGQLNQFLHYLSMFELNYMTKDEAKQGITVTDEDIREHRYRYGDLPVQVENIKSQYAQKISDALARQNKEAADFYTAERDRKIEDITNNFKSDEYVQAKVVKEKEQKIDQYFAGLENYRPDYERYKAIFKYEMKNTVTGEVFSNLEANNTENGQLKEQDMMFIRRYPGEDRGYLSSEEGAGTFAGFIALPKSAYVLNSVVAEYYDYQRSQKLFYLYTASGLIALLLSLYLLRTGFAMEAAGNFKLWQKYYARIPLDIRLLIWAVVGIAALGWLSDNTVLFHYGNPSDFFAQLAISTLGSAVLVGLTLWQGKYLWETLQEGSDFGTQWQRSLTYRSIGGLSQAFAIASTGTQVLILSAVAFILGAGAIMVLIENRFIVFYVPVFLVIGVPALVLVIKRTGYFNSIVRNVNELALGSLGPDLPVQGNSALANLAQNINSLKHGVRVSRSEQAKSERLKTELITNVSHDLRTPLTSIITYTELLKNPNLSGEDSQAYVQIIDRKSKRLKVLIDDLFEVSKMASGSMELAKEKVDLGQLLEQALAEHDEAISASTLMFRVNKPNQPVYAFVDGQKMWRVFDNLIGNILKYALENTRVYISLQADKGQAVIAFKNVTKYELGENIDELLERFKRADKSRNTEGSGLGLAIAKSIIDLHHGFMDIGLDGDLFKITISLETLP